jgi:hypothetical protein
MSNETITNQQIIDSYLMNEIKQKLSERGYSVVLWDLNDYRVLRHTEGRASVIVDRHLSTRADAYIRAIVLAFGVQPVKHDVQLYSISINGNLQIVDKPRLSYEEIVQMANASDESTIIYSCAAGCKAGILHRGQSVSVADGMVIRVALTGDA